MRIWKLAQSVMCGPCAVMVTNKSLDRWWSCSHWAGGVDSYWGEATFTPIGSPRAGQPPDWLVVSVIMADMQWTSLCQETHWAELLTTTTTANHCHLSMTLILYHTLYTQIIMKVSFIKEFWIKSELGFEVRQNLTRVFLSQRFHSFPNFILFFF